MKELDRAEDRLQDAQNKLKRAEEKQEKAEAKAQAKDTELKPAQAKKLDAAIASEKKKVEKAKKDLARVRKKHARGSREAGDAQTAATDVGGLDAKAASAAIQDALAHASKITVTGEMSPSTEPLVLELNPGAFILWQAALAADCAPASIILKVSNEETDGEQSAPVFCIGKGASVYSACEGACVIEGSGVDVKIDGGHVHGLHGDGIRTDGAVEMLHGAVAAAGAKGKPGIAVHGSSVKLEGGFVLGRAPSKSGAGDGRLSKASVVEPAAGELKEGAGCVCVWVTSDGEMPKEDGSESGLVYWPEDACVWWDVAPDGATSIYAGRQKESNSVDIGTQTLPGPPSMQKAGNKIVSMPIVFEAKTKDAERPVLLNIEWGWDLFLTRKGAEQYDNRIAIAACALSNSAYKTDDVEALLGRLGFGDAVHENQGKINTTSAFTLAHAQISDGRTKKTMFAVVNRGSKTLMDWKGNILDETIQNARFFGDSADAVAAALQEYTGKYGQSKPENNIFFVTGHSLGAVVTDLLAAQHFQQYPAKNVFAYSFAAPLADPAAETGDSRPIYNILNQNDVVTSFPPRGGYKRVGADNYTFSTTGKNAHAMARPFRFLSHMDIDALSRMSSFTGFFKKAIPSIMWNHSLTTYMAYLLAGGPDSVKGSGGLWSMLQTVITAVGGSEES